MILSYMLWQCAKACMCVPLLKPHPGCDPTAATHVYVVITREPGDDGREIQHRGASIHGHGCGNPTPPYRRNLTSYRLSQAARNVHAQQARELRRGRRGDPISCDKLESDGYRPSKKNSIWKTPRKGLSIRSVGRRYRALHKKLASSWLMAKGVAGGPDGNQ